MRSDARHAKAGQHRPFNYIRCAKTLNMRFSTIRNGLLILGLIFCGAAEAQDIYISSTALPRYIKANTNYQVKLQVKNNGPGFCTSFGVRWRLDGGNWSTTMNQGIQAPGLGTGGYYMPVTHNVNMNTTAGQHTLEINVILASDPSQANNSVTIPFTALSNWADKVALLEGRTETWCQYCPTANTVTNALAANPDFAIVKFHLSDALDDCVECADYYDQYNITFTPAGMLDMGEYGSYTINSQSNTWEDALEARVAGVAPAELTMTSSVNTTTRLLTVTLNAEFTYAFTGPFRMNVYVAEDDVLGPQTNGGMGSNYVHNRVMRAMLGGAEGSSDVIPTTPVVGTTYSRTYTWTVPAGYDLGELHLVGVLEHRPSTFGNRYTVNAVNRAAMAVGIEELGLGDGRLEAYPNPFNDQLFVHVSDYSGMATISLIGVDGRVVLKDNITLSTINATAVDLTNCSLTNGAYVLRVDTPEGSAAQRLIMTR